VGHRDGAFVKQRQVGAPAQDVIHHLQHAVQGLQGCFGGGHRPHHPQTSGHVGTGGEPQGRNGLRHREDGADGARLEVEPVPELCQQALENYRDKQSVIEADVWHALGEAKLPPSCLNDNNRFLAHSVSAALSLGDLNYLNTDVAWGEKLLYYYSLPPEMLGDYLRIYRHAAEVHLDERGKPILAWLDEQIEAQEEKLN